MMVATRLGPGTTWQDFGRPGYRRFGVPPGGAFDVEAMKLANRLAGNRPGEPTIELSIFGGDFLATAPCVAVVVAPHLVQCVALAKGERLTLSLPPHGVRAYVTCSGTALAGRVLGSASGSDVLLNTPLFEARTGHCGTPMSEERPAPEQPLVLRVTPDPSSPFEPVTWHGIELEASDRMDRTGIRFVGQSLGAAREIVSEPTTFGTVQVTPGDELVVLGPDGPTIGGYPKLGCVCRADLGKLAQIRPGDRVRLEPLDRETALAMWREKILQ